jgi:hypothetical protein
VRQFANQFGRDAGRPLGVLERVRLDAFLIHVKAGRRALDEVAVLQPGRDDLTTDRIGQRDVRADIQPEPAIGPLGRAGPARIDDVETRAVVDPLQDVVEVDRVRLTRVRPPQDDEIRVVRFLI